MEQKIEFMKRAMALAEKGCGHTSPNPMVGCVVVKDGRIIGEGYHEKCGENHAERNALLHCTEDPVGADLYVTLEPCCHYGKTPPCTEIILEKKISRVFIGAVDSNPLVGGKGIQILKDHGLYVESGILEEECRKQNEVFFHYITEKTPFVAMKYAMTLDGKIACETGDAKWVTGEEARHQVHELRNRYKGIMVGIRTVLADDPMLNCRLEEGGVDPIRIICDSSLRIPLDSQIVRTAQQVPVIVAYASGSNCPIEKINKLKRTGVQLLETQGDKVDMKELMVKLGAMNIDSILLEGGGRINASALEAGIVHKVYAYIAPKLVGGAKARTPIGGYGIQRMSDAIALEEMRICTVGEDLCVTGYLSGQKK